MSTAAVLDTSTLKSRDSSVEVSCEMVRELECPGEPAIARVHLTCPGCGNHELKLVGLLCLPRCLSDETWTHGGPKGCGTRATAREFCTVLGPLTL